MKNLPAFYCSSELFRKNAFSVIVAVLISSTLVTSQIFSYPSTTTLCLYMGAGLLVCAFTGLIAIGESVLPQITSVSVVVFIFAVYIVLHGIFIVNDFNMFHCYLLINLAILLSLSILLCSFGNSYATIFLSITVFAGIESLICIGQYFRFIGTLNSYFTVTGSLENPNVTAMFLAMSIPSIWFSVTRKTILTKKASIVVLVAVVSAILILGCRTAIIGSATEIIVILFYRLDLLRKALAIKNRSLTILLVFVIAFAGFALGSAMYDVKKASADGRKLIWKISAAAIMSEPIGSGYGFFERDYNLQQARYFMQGSGTAQERKNAAFVGMGYNELLENGIEGGIVGAILIGTLFYFLLKMLPSRDVAPIPPGKTAASGQRERLGFQTILAYAGVVSFIVMSLMNFTFRAIPAMCVFMVYSAILVGQEKMETFPDQAADGVKKGTRPALVGKYSRQVIGATVFAVTCLLVFRLSEYAIDSASVKTAQRLIHNKEYSAAILSLSKITSLSTDDSYWTAFGDALSGRRKYAEAIHKYRQAASLTSDPRLYLKLGHCYQMAGDFKSAEFAMRLASGIEPSRLKPQAALLNLYLARKDTARVIALAELILRTTPKIANAESEHYKRMAGYALSKIKALAPPFASTSLQTTKIADE